MSGDQAKKSGGRRPKLRAVDPNDPELGWQAGFLVDQYGKPKACARTLGLIVRNWPPFEGLRLNELTLEVEQNGQPITEAQHFRWREQIEASFRFPVPPELLQDTIGAVAEERSYHPIRDYLDGLEWDGVHRIHVAPAELLDCHDPLAGRYLICWMTAAVARIYQPGCQVDIVLTLFSQEGGRKKTTWFRVLFGDGRWTAAPFDPANKDSYLIAHQHWGYLLDEVDELTRTINWPAIKRTITNPDDSIRAPYERRPARRKRRFVFCATTNEREFLPHDPAGSRRWLIIDVGAADPSARIAKLIEWRDQLWAEAKYRFQQYTAGEEKFRWWLTEEEEAQREADADRHRRHEIADEKLEEHFAKQYPGSEIRVADVLETVFKIPPDRLVKEQALARKVGNRLRALGYTQCEREHNGVRTRIWRKA